MRVPLLLLLALSLAPQTVPSAFAEQRYRVQGRYVVIDSDIIAGTVEDLEPGGTSLKGNARQAISTGAAFWPRTIDLVRIPFVNQSTDANVANAITAVNRQLTGILQLVPRTDEAGHLVFTNERGLCNSWVGRRGMGALRPGHPHGSAATGPYIAGQPA